MTPIFKSYREIDLNENTKLVFNPKLVFEIYREDGFWCSVDKNLNIDAFAEDINKLNQDIESQIRSHWTAFTKCEDSKLSACAIELKQRLLSRMKEVKK